MRTKLPVVASTDLPTVAAYLERLPDGIASYPDCRAKASLVSGVLESRPVDPERADLPKRLVELIAAPPPISSWVLETELCAVALAIYDVHFQSLGREAFVQWIYEFNSELFGTPLYRILYAFLSPVRLIKLSASRWGAFHRGTNLTVVESHRQRASLRLDFPPHLFDPLMLHGFLAAWRAAAVACGAEQCHADVERITASRAEYRIAWE